MNSLPTIPQVDLIDSNGFQLNPYEEYLILRLRSYTDAVLEVSTKEGLPQIGKLNITGLRERLRVRLYPLTDNEKYLINWLRLVPYGKLIVIIQGGIPSLAESSSFASLNLQQFPEDIEFDGTDDEANP